ncbi:MAG: Hint domain-containing protein [Paracoccaceae bacterium]|nr:Hint domain-containing protein [Paracoccaceae bacterium]
MNTTRSTPPPEDDILRSVLQTLIEPAIVPQAEVARPAAMPEVAPGAWQLPGFTAKTRIRTAFGEMPIEALRLRDEVRTSAGRILRVAWIDQIRLDEAYLQHHPEAQPFMIRANALDYGKPLRDLLISPRQEMSHGLANFQIRFATADSIKGRAGVFRRPGMAVTYYLFHCGEPATVFAEGVPVNVAPLPTPIESVLDEDP